ncbi:endonuclease domain-containing protein [Longimonas sp.]|uniref:endonuclease domain-containing protein n=1 Tax=Longimonas sp. TaxID=2039626 RepID=UPI0033659664
MKLHNRQSLKQRRKELRNNATPAEAQLWSALKKRQLSGRKFRRQHSIGPYIVDFYCPGERLVIELDGATHDGPLRSEYDAERQVYLETKGIRVVRFENKQVFKDEEGVLAYIRKQFHD